ALDQAIRVALPDGSTVSAILTSGEAHQGSNWILVYAPGAGSSLRDPFGEFAARMLPRHGIDVLRFQFPYAEAARHPPDRTPVLEATWRAAIEAARAPERRLVVSGRSMGGRIASQVV